MLSCIVPISVTALLPDFKKLLRINVIGQTDQPVISDIEKNNLKENLVIKDHLPHREGLIERAKSQVLLLPLNDAPNVKGILPGKMYEYMALRRPILALGPTDADYAEILNDTKAGIPLGFNDIEGIKKTLLEFFLLFREHKLTVQSGAYEKYSRKNLAEQFVRLVQ